MAGVVTPNFEEAGLRFVAIDAAQFEAIVTRLDGIIERLERQLQRVATTETKAATGANKVTESTEKQGKSFDRISPKVRQLSNIFATLANRMASASPFGYSLSSALQLIGSTSIGTAVGIGSLVAGVAAFLAVSHRGAAIEGVAIAFGKLSEKVGMTAQEFSTNLKSAARGTVSDFELMKQANLALAGATGKYRDEFAKDLPRILELARMQSIATGQSVDYLFNSLVLGVKRASPRLIDNTGIVIRMSDTYEEFAAKLHKNADALTDEEKQLAVLDAIMDAHKETVDLYGDSLDTAAVSEQQLTTTLQNFIDQLGLKAQPAYKEFLKVMQAGTQNFIDNFDNIVVALQPFIQGIGTAIQAFTKMIADAAQAIANSGIMKTIVDVLGVGIQMLGDLIGALQGAISPVLNWVVENVLKVADLALKGIVIIFAGIGRAIGDIANGLIWVYVHVIAPVIEWIAQGIADFLIGKSPPPKGPLSHIDEGGKRTMEAWLAGFASANIQPVSQVAAAVADAMGAVANMTLPQVKARIEALDAAIQPFRDQLDIVKARFEEISKPAEEAFKAIDRQIGKAMEALARGDTTAAATIRSLDAQRDAIQGYVDAQQESLDLAQIQLTLMESMQGEERALLKIREAMLPVEEQSAKAADEKAKKAKAGKAEAARTTMGGIGARAKTPGELIHVKPPPEGTGMETDGGGQSALGAFLGIDEKLVAQAQSKSRNISDIVGTIQKATSGTDNPVGKAFERMFKSIGESITKWISDQLDPNFEGGLANFFLVKLPGLFVEIGKSIATWWDTNVRQPLLNSAIGPMIVAIELFFADLPGQIMAGLASIPEVLNNGLLQPFLGLIDSIIGGIEDFINNTVIGTVQALVRAFRPFFEVFFGKEKVGQFVDSMPRLMLGRVSAAGQLYAAQRAASTGRIQQESGYINMTPPSGASQIMAGVAGAGLPNLPTAGTLGEMTRRNAATTDLTQDNPWARDLAKRQAAGLAAASGVPTPGVIPGVTSDLGLSGVTIAPSASGQQGPSALSSYIDKYTAIYYGIQDQKDAARRAAAFNSMIGVTR